MNRLSIRRESNSPASATRAHDFHACTVLRHGFGAAEGWSVTRGAADDHVNAVGSSAVRSSYAPDFVIHGQCVTRLRQCRRPRADPGDDQPEDRYGPGEPDPTRRRTMFARPTFTKPRPAAHQTGSRCGAPPTRRRWRNTRQVRDVAAPATPCTAPAAMSTWTFPAVPRGKVTAVRPVRPRTYKRLRPGVSPREPSRAAGPPAPGVDVGDSLQRAKARVQFVRDARQRNHHDGRAPSPNAATSTPTSAEPDGNGTAHRSASTATRCAAITPGEPSEGVTGRTWGRAASPPQCVSYRQGFSTILPRVCCCSSSR